MPSSSVYYWSREPERGSLTEDIDLRQKSLTKVLDFSRFVGKEK